MKILVVTPYFYPHPGGSQRYIEGLYTQLIKVDSKIKVDVLTYNTEGVSKTEKYKGLTIYRVGCVEILRGQFAIPNYIEVIRLSKKLKVKGYDVVNAHTRFFESSWWGPILANYLKAKKILTDHCAYHPIHKSLMVRLVAKVVDRVMIPILSKMYDGVVVVSEATRDFVRNYGMGKVEIMYGGVNRMDVKEASKKKRRIPKVGEIGKGEIVVAFVGRMIDSKGPQLVVEVARQLEITNPNVQFVFAGDGPLLDELKKHKSSNIHILGRLNKDEVKRLMNSVDILVHPSTHHEGLPMVLLEAGSAGCTVIATDRGGVRELIKHNNTGIITNVGVDDIKKSVEILIKDSKMRKRMGENLRKLVEKQFSWKVNAKKYYKYLMKVIKYK